MQPEQLVELPVKHTPAPNVACTIPGESSRVIIVGAHFDYVERGKGVVDNWSGASMLPSLLEAIAKEPRRHTYLLIGFTDEEQGLVGSTFVTSRKSSGRVSQGWSTSTPWVLVRPRFGCHMRLLYSLSHWLTLRKQ